SAALRVLVVEPAGAAGADGRRVRGAAVRGGPALGGTGRRARRGRRARAHPGRGADVPLRQPGRAVDPAARRGRVRGGAGGRRGVGEGVDVVAGGRGRVRRL